MRMSELYRRDPKAALDFVLKLAEERHQRAFLYTSVYGNDGVCYGSFKYLSRRDLQGRTYAIEFWDDAVSLLWLDRIHETTLRPTRTVPLEDAALPSRWQRK